MKSIVSLLGLLCLFGCASYDNHPLNKQSQVASLGQLLPDPEQPVRLVFLHGISDHFPGYALGAGANAWMNEAGLKGLNFVPEGAVQPGLPVPLVDFKPHAPGDAFSQVSYQTRNYRLSIAGKPRKVQVVEITWSGLTRWLKSKYLGFDTRQQYCDAASGTPCVPWQKKTPAELEQVPPRVWANRVLKEDLIDRGLADAALYAGSYGAVIRDGVRLALYKALCPQGCDDPQASPASNALLFVTHSMGSRILFDILGSDKAAASGQHPPPAAFTEYLLAHTRAVYMLSNQVSLFGLAHIEPSEHPGGPINPYRDLTDLQLGESAKPVQSEVADPLGLRKALVKRQQVLARKENQPDWMSTVPPQKLELVAFTDPNDLLSWPLPEWYRKSLPGTNVSNILVQNDVHWLGLFERPDTAHLDYFTRPGVWSVIVNGH